MGGTGLHLASNYRWHRVVVLGAVVCPSTTRFCYCTRTAFSLHLLCRCAILVCTWLVRFCCHCAVFGIFWDGWAPRHSNFMGHRASELSNRFHVNPVAHQMYSFVTLDAWVVAWSSGCIDSRNAGRFFCSMLFWVSLHILMLILLFAHVPFWCIILFNLYCHLACVFGSMYISNACTCLV